MIPLQIGLCFRPAFLGEPGHARALDRLDVLMFPELADGGYAALSAGAPPHRPGDAYLSAFASASRRHELACISGSTCVAGRTGRRTNTAFVFDHGRQVHRYDKIHLFKPTGDHRFFAPGRAIQTFTLKTRAGRLPAGVIICYDLRFPELVRAMAKQGIKILFVPARWPGVRDEVWHALLKARAIENQMFVLGCNAQGPEGGHSYAFDPMGGEVFSTRGKRAVDLAAFRIDLDQLTASRALHDNLRSAVVLHRTVFPRRIIPASGRS